MYLRFRYCCCYTRTTGQICLILLRVSGYWTWSPPISGRTWYHCATLPDSCSKLWVYLLSWDAPFQLQVSYGYARDASSNPQGSRRDIAFSQGVRNCHAPQTLISLASHHITSHHFYIYVSSDWLLRLIANISFYCLTCGDTFLRNDRLW